MGKQAVAGMRVRWQKDHGHVWSARMDGKVVGRLIPDHRTKVWGVYLYTCGAFAKTPQSFAERDTLAEAKLAMVSMLDLAWKVARKP